jgi:hypothetical protein
MSQILMGVFFAVFVGALAYEFMDKERTDLTNTLGAKRPKGVNKIKY